MASRTPFYTSLMSIFGVLAFLSVYGCDRESSFSLTVEGKPVTGYELVGYFSEGKAAVRKLETFGEFGYIDKDGAIACEFSYDDVGPFSEGLAPVKKFDRGVRKDRYGYIDASGTLHVALQFADAGAFSEGLAAVRVGRKYGYIDRDGKMIISPQFDVAFPFAGGLAKVVVKGFCGFVDKAGKQVIEPRFFRAGFFSEGLVALATRDRFGYADHTGKFVIEPQFDEAGEFKDGLAPVRTGKKWKYINRAGKMLSDEEYDEARPFSEGLAVVGVVRTNFKDSRWGGVFRHENGIRLYRHYRKIRYSAEISRRRILFFRVEPGFGAAWRLVRRGRRRGFHRPKRTAGRAAVSRSAIFQGRNGICQNRPAAIRIYRRNRESDRSWSGEHFSASFIRFQAWAKNQLWFCRADGRTGNSP